MERLDILFFLNALFEVQVETEVEERDQKQ